MKPASNIIVSCLSPWYCVTFCLLWQLDSQAQISPKETGVAPVDQKAIELFGDRTKHSDLLHIRHFCDIHVTYQGTAQKMGLDKIGLEDFVGLKFKSLFTGYDLRKFRDVLPIRDSEQEEWGLLHIKIWTVGEDYPVAFHVSLAINRLSPGGHGYDDAVLGYNSAEELKNGRLIKNTINDLMESGAAKLMKIQRKL